MPSGTKFGFGDSSFPVLTCTTALWTSSELGKPQEVGVHIVVLLSLAMMSPSVAFFTKMYTLFFIKSFFPFLSN